MTRQTKHRLLAGMAMTTAIGLIASGCGSSKTSTTAGSQAPKTTTMAAQQSIGQGEGQLDIIAWAGYAENGSNDPTVNWVSKFETDSGCKVNVKVGNTSDEMVQLMQTGQYDGVSASGDASQRLIVGGNVAPVNTDLLTNYPDVSSFLKMQSYNSADGVAYGMPHGWGANLLMWNPKVVTTAPDSWSAVYDQSSANKGKITAYNAAITIADAAVYLKSSQPDLAITDPYALKQNQFDAAVNLLKQQKPLIGEYWADYAKAATAFQTGSLVLGSGWQLTANYANATKAGSVETVLPKEGATAWSDTWMISSKAKHPNCMYKWMNYITNPEVQAQVAEYFGEAPANTKACAMTTDSQHCPNYHAQDEAYAKQLYYWTTPTKKCVDGSGDDCVGFQEWTAAWNDLTAS
jgi:putative spermidine/putrescine transport system substrate-binding protein